MEKDLEIFSYVHLGDCFFLLFQYVHPKKLFIFSYWITSIHV